METDPPRILYVEDHSDAAEMLRIELTASGPYDVSIAGSGEEAIELLHRQTFDLYIVDFFLPGISGAELCRQIRELHPAAPIIACSASKSDLIKKDALGEGATEFVSKPFDLDEILDAVKRSLSESNPRPAFGD
jgi:CheY-like chemotaxis protein